ncbi:MAG: signal transduction histidine kinase, LytS [Verrucomicrobiales bacterium]|nr:signal transduction histidine kinase, LytS [Verrucomicrobiales bacterium]
MTASRHSGILKLLLYLGGWTAIAITFAGQFYVSSSRAGLNVSLPQALKSSLADWYTYGVLCLPVYFLILSLHKERIGGKKKAVFLVIGSILFTLSYVVVRGLLSRVTERADLEGADISQYVELLFLKTWHFNLLVYWVIVVLMVLVHAYWSSQIAEKRAVVLESELQKAKLQALQMQLNPHFLFNSLNSISALMYQDVEAADRMLIQLSELLRSALKQSDEQMVALSKEVNLLKKYLAIEEIRFGNRLKVNFDLPEELLSFKVPTLILQPLVENALKHGIGKSVGEVRLEISAREEASRVILSVCDNGKGLPTTQVVEGVGLSNIRNRLHETFGEGKWFEISNQSQGGVCCRILLPNRGS